MKATVTVVIEMYVEVEVEAETPSEAIKDALSRVDEDGYNAGTVESFTPKLDRIQFGTLDADVAISQDTKAILAGDYRNSARYTIRPYLLGDSGPRLDCARYADALGSLDDWVEEAAERAS